VNKADEGALSISRSSPHAVILLFKLDLTPYIVLWQPVSTQQRCVVLQMSRDAQEAEVAPVAKPKLHAVARLPRRTQYQLDKAYSPYKAAPWALRYTGKICSLGFDDFKELDRNLSESRRLVMADYLAAQVMMFWLF